MSLPAPTVKITKLRPKEPLLPTEHQAGAGRRRMSDFIDEFIQEYKNNPCLWKANSINFKNRTKRQEAYMKLIEVATRHGEHYNIERTKQKINNLRCAFRHQLKKYTECKNSKNGKDEMYCPKRRYFESLMFLMEEEKPANRLKLAEKLKENKMTKVSPVNNKKEQSVATPTLRRKEMATRVSTVPGDNTILQMKIGIETIEELGSSCVDILPEGETKEIIEIDPEEEEEAEAEEEEEEDAGDATVEDAEDTQEQHLEETELCDVDGTEFCTVNEEEEIHPAESEADENSDVKNQCHSQSLYRTTSPEGDQEHHQQKIENNEEEITIDCEEEEINILWPRPPPSRTGNNEGGPLEAKSIEIVHVETQAAPPPPTSSQSAGKAIQQTLPATIMHHDFTNSVASSTSSAIGQNSVASTTLTLPTSITIQPVPKASQNSSTIIENQQRQQPPPHQQNRQSLIRRRTASVSSNNSNVSAVHVGQLDQQPHYQQVHYLHSSDQKIQQHHQYHHQNQHHQDVSEVPEKKIKIDCSSRDFEKLLTLACSRVSATSDSTSDDNFSMFGRMVAHKLRSMDSQQAMFAEKIISDVLFDGQMRLLNYPQATLPMTITQHHQPPLHHQRSISTSSTAIPIHHGQHVTNSTPQQTYVISTVDLNGAPAEIHTTSTSAHHHHHHQHQQQQQLTTPRYTMTTTNASRDPNISN